MEHLQSEEPFSSDPYFSRVFSFLEDSWANLVSFKIMVLFVLICIESTTILKEARFVQLSCYKQTLAYDGRNFLFVFLKNWKKQKALSKSNQILWIQFQKIVAPLWNANTNEKWTP